MKLLKIGKYLINPRCIVQAWTNSDASEIKVRLLCNNSAVGVEGLCVVENKGMLDKLDAEYLTFVGEESKALKSYFTNSKVDWCDGFSGL